MNKTRAILILLVIFSLAARAQHMKKAVGVRDGTGFALTYQFFYEQDRDVKLMLNTRDHGIQFTALLQRYEPVLHQYGNSFFFYYGAGAHIGFTGNKPALSRYAIDDENANKPFTNKGIIGADGMIGIEYRAHSVPMSFGLEYKPFFDLFGHRVFRLALLDIGFAVRYHF